MVGPRYDSGPSVKDYASSTRNYKPVGNLRSLVCTLISGISIAHGDGCIGDVYIQCGFAILVGAHQCDCTSGIHGEAQNEQYQRQAIAEFSRIVGWVVWVEEQIA